ncbi:MAG: SMI1/KNR4 family protein [Pseudomonadota bacterium]|nr:SMI1/KNR4 family protein [Pseudomonadota bacterium]
MTQYAKEQIKLVWEQLEKAISAREHYFHKVPNFPQVGVPATEKDITELERHWQLQLPPSYRNFISLYNGVHNFFYDAALLSTHDIIEGEDEEWRQDIEEFLPGFSKFIFVGDKDSYSGVFCFDKHVVSEDGEMEVVHLSIDGEETRWSSFGAYLQDYLKVTRKTLEHEQADRKDLNE